MSTDLIQLQREFDAYSRVSNVNADRKSFVAWLQMRRDDAGNDWHRLCQRVKDEQLRINTQEQEVEFLKTKYIRYYSRIGIDEVDHVLAPWTQGKPKKTKECPKGPNTQRCPQPRCQRSLPISGSLTGHNPPLCGICATMISVKKLSRSLSNGGELYHCDSCKHDICILCGRGFNERICKTCNRVVGFPPTNLLSKSSTFCCWVCETNQEDKRQAKLTGAQQNGKLRDAFRCGECSTAICVECAKPTTYQFDPDYGFIRNCWYKFVDNFWDPPEAHGGFEKYLRRERRLGIPQFDLEDLYTPAYKIDPDDDDTTLYDKVAPNEVLHKQSPPSFGGGLNEDCPVVKEDITHQPKKRQHRGRNCKVRRVDFGREIPPPQGYDDFWYAENNRRLYNLASQWSDTYFGKNDFPEKYNDKTWLYKLNDQFKQYANIVAHEDSFFGPNIGGKKDGWEHILRDKKNRKWLIVGILAQIIEKKIYVELLFGATDEQTKNLEKQDSDNIMKDGYARAAVRSQSINLMLGRRVVPDNFYQKVDDLTAYTASIFQDIFALTQVYDDVYNGLKIDHEYKTKREDRIGFMYSELHFIIAHAAYFAVCMRRSSSIFHFLSATPAARMDYPIEGQACYELYQMSKEEAERRETIKTAEDKSAIEALKKAGGTLEEIAAETKDRRIAAHYRIRGAKVKFAVWPMITRYRAENIGLHVVHPKGFSHFEDEPDLESFAPLTQDKIESGEGQRIVEIGKCVVIYYQGIIYPKPFKAGETFESDGLPLNAYMDLENPDQSYTTWQKVGMRKLVLRFLTVALFAISHYNRSWIGGHLVHHLFLVFMLIAIYFSFCKTLAGKERVSDCIRKVGYPLMLGTTARGLHLLTIYFRDKELSGLCGVYLHLITLSTWNWATFALLTIAGAVLPRTRNATLTGLYGALVSWSIWWLYYNSSGTMLSVIAIGYQTASRLGFESYSASGDLAHNT